MKKIITPKTVSQHVKEEFRRGPEFRKAYKQEVAQLQKKI